MFDFDIDGVYESVKDEVSKEKPAGSNYSGPAPWSYRLRLKKGCRYLVRILPYVKEGKEGYSKWVFKYISYSWKSVVDGKFIQAQSPATFGLGCPMEAYRNNYRQNHTDEQIKKLNERLQRKEERYIGVYLVDTNDKDAEKFKGQVRVVRCTFTLWNIINRALRGEHDAEWTSTARRFSPNAPEIRLARMIFDPNPSGVNFDIIVTEEKNGFTSYADSRFTYEGADLGLSEDELKEMIDSVPDLSTINYRLDPEKAEKLFKETFLGIKDDTSATADDGVDIENNDAIISAAPKSAPTPPPTNSMPDSVASKVNVGSPSVNEPDEMQDWLDDISAGI